jgi:hypothetical protein
MEKAKLGWVFRLENVPSARIDDALEAEQTGGNCGRISRPLFYQKQMRNARSIRIEAAYADSSSGACRGQEESEIMRWDMQDARYSAERSRVGGG